MRSVRPLIAACLLATSVAAVGSEPATAVDHPALGRLIVASASGLERGISDTAALSELRTWDRLMTDAWHDGELSRMAVIDDPLVAGRQHERFQQAYLDVPIWGGDERRQLNAFGQTESIFGTYYPDVDVAVTPAIPASRAAQLLADAGAGTPATPPAELEILPTDQGFRLTWTSRVTSATDGVVRRIFVDAQTGAVVFQYADSCILTSSPADVAGRASDDTGAPTGAAVQAAVNATADYYARRLGRTGLATKDLTRPSALVDIVAHELTHGVTDETSHLAHLDESGTLSEAFSDMMGISARFFEQPPAGDVGPADWVIGAGAPLSPGGGRSLATPDAQGAPDHYSLKVATAADDGGVHTNASIVTQMFYLAVMGGTNRVSGLAVDGVGFQNRAQVERVIYRAFTLLLPARATFGMARAATIQAALDLDGADSAALRAIVQAWTAVGVDLK